MRKRRQLIPSQAKPVSTNQILLLIKELLNLILNVQEDVVLRFAAKRNIAKMPQPTLLDKPVVPWQLTLGCRSADGRRATEIFRYLARSAVWQLIMGRLRPANQQRQPPLQDVQKLVGMGPTDRSHKEAGTSSLQAIPSLGEPSMKAMLGA